MYIELPPVRKGTKPKGRADTAKAVALTATDNNDGADPTADDGPSEPPAPPSVKKAPATKRGRKSKADDDEADWEGEGEDDEEYVEKPKKGKGKAPAAPKKGKAAQTSKTQGKGKDKDKGAVKGKTVEKGKAVDVLSEKAPSPEAQDRNPDRRDGQKVVMSKVLSADFISSCASIF